MGELADMAEERWVAGWDEPEPADQPDEETDEQ